MERKIIVTRDGSATVEIPELKVTYHSRHGAINESMHVFIEAGWKYKLEQKKKEETITILEMGFGTGLNAFLTLLEAEKEKRAVHYTSLEPYPLSRDEAVQLNYIEVFGNAEWFGALHKAVWNEDKAITQHFTLHKSTAALQEFQSNKKFDIIYYDAFAPAAQPELWTTEIFSKLFNMLHEGGILVTYCSKSVVRHAMRDAGFTISKIPGPPGKREMVRAERS